VTVALFVDIGSRKPALAPDIKPDHDLSFANIPYFHNVHLHQANKIAGYHTVHSLQWEIMGFNKSSWIGIKTPIVSAPMYFAVTPELSAAVTASGGFGFLPAGEF